MCLNEINGSGRLYIFVMDKVNFLHEWVRKHLGKCSSQVERVELSICDEGEFGKVSPEIGRRLAMAGVSRRRIRAASGELLCATCFPDGKVVLQHGIAVLAEVRVTSLESLWDFVEVCAARNVIDLSGEALCACARVFLKNGDRMGWARVGSLDYLRA